MEGSQASNVIPDQARIGGTLRTFMPEVRTAVIARMENIVRHVAEAFGLSAEIEWAMNAYPALINHSKQTEIVVRATKGVVGADMVLSERTDPVEDFAFYLQTIPRMLLLPRCRREPSEYSFSRIRLQ